MEQSPLSLRQACRDPWHLLILLGMLCQGYTWDGLPFDTVMGEIVSVVIGLGYVGLWCITVLSARSKRLLSPTMEAVLVGATIYLTYNLGPQVSTNRLTFIGNGLVIIQVVHMLRPTTLRERMWSIGIGIAHLAIASQTMTDYYNFPVVMLFGMVLVPKAMFQLEAARYRKLVTTERIEPRRRTYLYLAILMCVYFVALPKLHMNTPLPTGGQTGAGGQMREDLDSAGGGTAADDHLIFRVSGPNLGYLKINALDEFDGRIWKSTPWSQKEKSEDLRGHPNRDSWLHREVTVISPSVLRDHLPVDGSVQNVRGPFSRFRLSDSGGAKFDTSVYQTMRYEYWTVPEDPKERLHPEHDLERYTKLPPVSPELREWVTARLGTTTDTFEQARKLTTYMRDNFEYDLGAPTLDQEIPVDDFVFNQKRGHCERFASALAVMLRMQGIPSRVGIGYMPVERNDLGDFYNIRTKHGHAWTEAYFPGRGWIVFDATPAGTGGIAQEDRGFSLTVIEWLKDRWYAKVVEFDSTDQSAIFDFVGSRVTRLANMALDNLGRVAMLVTLLGLLGLATRLPWRKWLRRFGQAADRQAQLREAQHFYGRMQKTLARDRWLRRGDETPLEFLAYLRRSGHPAITEIELVTRRFCAVRYGEAALTEADRDAVDAALLGVGRMRFRPPAGAAARPARRVRPA